MASEAETPFKYGDHGEIIDRATGEVIGYAPGHDPKIAEGVDIFALTTAFPTQAIKEREGGGGKRFRYVSTDTVIRRLNATTGNRWSYEVIGYEFRDGGTRTDRNGNVIGQQVMLVHGRLTIPGLGSRDGFGVQRLDDPITNTDDLLKAARGDALKTAAVAFGVAIDLYGPDLEAMDEPTPVPQQRPQQAQQSAQQNRQQAAPPTPLRSRTTQAIERLEHDRDEGVIGAATVPLRDEAQARRMTAQAQGPRAPQPRTGVDPATIPGVVKGVQNAKPAASRAVPDGDGSWTIPTEVINDEERFWYPQRYTGGKMDAINAVLADCGLTGGNMGEAIRAVNTYVEKKFGVKKAVQGSGDWEDNEYGGQYKVWPKDIANCIAYWKGQESMGGAAEAREAASNDPDDGWGDEQNADDIPF